MNKDNAKDYLPLVQALADGKTIQRDFGTGIGWEDTEDPSFIYGPGCYRVKPEPRERWVVEYTAKSGSLRMWVYETETEARETASHPCVIGAAEDGNIRVYKVREVCS